MPVTQSATTLMFDHSLKETSQSAFWVDLRLLSGVSESAAGTRMVPAVAKASSEVSSSE